MTTVITQIKIRIGERDIELTQDEARDLYEKLKGLFGEPVPQQVPYPVPYYPVPYYPYVPPEPYWPYKIEWTCGGGTLQGMYGNTQGLSSQGSQVLT